MDINKIVEAALLSSVKLLQERENSDLPKFDGNLGEKIEMHRNLMAFSTELLRHYHLALKEELLKHGIDL